MTRSFKSYLPAVNLGSAAVALALPVFPCGADKQPMTKHGFKDATVEPEEVERLFQNPQARMIGVPTGSVTGWYVIDVDIKDGARGHEWLTANSSKLVSTRTHKTQSGGLHLVFSLPEGKTLRNSASRIAPGVDVRGDGGYVIAPPSPGYSIADLAPIAEMPDWLFIAASKPEPVYQPPIVGRHLTQGGTAYGLTALENECNLIRFAADGTKHATINKAGFAIGGLVANGELSAEAYSELLSALHSIRVQCRDFRAAEKTLERSFREGQGLPRAAPQPPPEPIHPAAEFLAKLQARARQKEIVALPVSSSFFDVQGALKLFVDHCEATAMSSQPFLALAAGITLVSVLAGRKYRTATDLRTNIYTIGVADSGAGKDHARKQAKVVLADAGLTSYLGGEDLASGASIFTALSRHPAVLFQIDEFGDWLADVLGPRAATHKKQIAQKLKTLYSSANTFLSGTEYADQSKTGRPREDIQHPHVCLYGTTTPAQFWSAIQGGSLHDGLMARMLLFVSPVSYPDEQEPNLSAPPAELIAAVKAIADGPTPHTDGDVGRLMLSNTVPTPFTVPNTPEAEAAWRSLRKEQLNRQRKAEGTYITAIAGRLAENAMKLALVRAVSRHSEAPEIQASDVAWGRSVSLHCMDTLLSEAEHHVSDSETEKVSKKVADIIRKSPKPITEAEMLRKGAKAIKKSDRAAALADLLQSGEVIAIPSSGNGPKTVRYALAVTDPSVLSLDSQHEQVLDE